MKKVREKRVRDNCEMILRQLTVIVGRNTREQLVKALLEKGAQLVITSYGEGTCDPNELLEALGLTVEKKKAVITCVIKRSIQYEIMAMLVDEFHFGEPNTGIAFTTPVGEMAY